MKILKPIFNRIGSKRNITLYLLSLFPPKIKTYVEPFLGSGVISWNVDAKIKVLNDLDKELIDDWKLIKKVDSNKIKNIKLKTEDIDSFYKSENNDNEHKLLKAMIKRSGGFGSKPVVNNKIYRKINPMRKIKYIDVYKGKLKNAKLYNQDYKTIIKKFDSQDTFFFLDPPYEKSNGLYKNEDFNFEELRDILKNIKGKFLLTLNNSKNIRKLFKDFSQKKIVIKAKGNHKLAVKDRHELIIKNF